MSEPKTTPTSKFFWKLWCEEIQENQNSKQNGRLVSWTGWQSQFLISAVRLESWFVEASCSFEPQPRLSFATGLSHLTPLLLSLLLKTNIIIIITMVVNSGTVTRFCTEYPWRQIYNENLYAKKYNNHQVWPRQGHRLEICRQFYTAGFLGQKFYTLKTHRLRLFF